MKLKPKPIDITAIQWNGHDDQPKGMRALVRRYDLSREQYPTLGYESVLFCCDKTLGEHGYTRPIDPSNSQVVCPGMWIVTEVNLQTSVLERVRAMTYEAMQKEYLVP